MRNTKVVVKTFSIPLDISVDLNSFVKKREISAFVSNAIRSQLEIKKNELKEAYLSANNDCGQIESIIVFSIN